MIHTLQDDLRSIGLKFLLLFILSIGIAGGVWFYQAEKQQHQHLVEGQLAAISQLKVKEIADWRSRMLDEAALLTESSFFAFGVEQYLQGFQLEKTDPLMDRIRSISQHYHYPGVIVVDQQGETRMTYGPFAHLYRNGAIKSTASEAVAQGRPVLSDLAVDAMGGVYFAVAAPLFKFKNGEPTEELIGTVVLVCDPKQFLFPLIQNWPVPSESAESLLVRDEGKEVLFLNELRHQNETALKLSIPLSRAENPAVKAVRGETGIVRGPDYRGEGVISYLQPIPGSPWFLVTKMDIREAFAQWHSISLMLLLVFSGIAGITVAAGLVFRQRNRKIQYQELYAAELKLRQSAERSSVILRGIGDGVIVTDLHGRVELLNPVAEKLTGRKQEDALGKPSQEVFQIIHEQTGKTVENLADRVLREGKIIACTNHSLLVRKEGRGISIAYSGAPLHDNHGNISGVVLVFRDRSKARLRQQLADKRLAIVEYANTNSLDSLLTKVLDEICDTVDSPVGFYHFVEPDQKTLSLQQWSTRTLQEFCKAEGKGRHYDIAQAGVWVDCLRERTPMVHNDYASLPNKKGLPEGHARIVRELVVPVLHNDKVVAILGVGNKPVEYDEEDVETVAYLAEVVYHIIEARRVEEALRASLQTSDDLVRAIPSGLFIYQYDAPDRLILLSCNPEAERIIERKMSRFIGMEFNEIWPEAKKRGTMDQFLEVMHTGRMFETDDLQYADDHLSGAYRIRAFVLPGGRLAVAYENITALKQAEVEKDEIHAQLMQAQKMESVGRLAGGVAHDFNNMLSVIIGNTEMALEQTKNESIIVSELQEIKKAALRSADLTRQLLAFARKQAVNPRVINLNHAIEGMLKMLYRLIGEDIKLTWLPGAGLRSIFIDPSQVDQILANLCVNARDAIQGVGQIIIETEDIVLTEEYCRDHAGFAPGEYVLLSFSDNGCGIPKENLGYIFEPFFTTKKQGEGTGLGLAMIYGIVKQNGGYITLYSEPGKGTTFRLYLPQHVEDTEEAEPSESVEAPRGRGETILLVEDETVILELNTRMLNRLGYQVLATSSTAEALALASKYKEKIQLVITDIIMPDMNGYDMAKKIWEFSPDRKCLFVSGYTANIIARQGFLPEGIHFLQKPFMKKDLAVKVREILAT